MHNKPIDIDGYIAGFPMEIQKKLEQIRAAIQKAAPESEEVISYGMPAFRMKTILVYFAGYSSHIGFYPTSSGIKNFKKELSVYKTARGSVQFPHDRPIPLKLITEIVKFRVIENLDKLKKKKRSSGI
jgi:uncharacterized protein YdhG (YjbR/CyaY superfamily)